MTTTTNGTYLLHDKNGPGGAYPVGQPCAPLFLVQLQADMNVDGVRASINATLLNGRVNQLMHAILTR